MPSQCQGDLGLSFGVAPRPIGLALAPLEEHPGPSAEVCGTCKESDKRNSTVSMYMPRALMEKCDKTRWGKAR